MRIPYIDRIRFSASTGCWLWNGYVSKDGYARIGGRSANRRLYEALVSPIGPGLELRHGKGCPRHCVNPFQCRKPGTHADNIRDTVADKTHNKAKLTHCPQGHPYSGTNSQGARVCRPCLNAASRRHYARKKARNAVS